MAHSQGFNFCDGAPLTGGERLELCYFPADGDDRSFAGGDGPTPPPSRQFNSGGINFDNSGFNPGGSDPITADEPAQAAPWRPGGCTYIAQDPCARPTRAHAPAERQDPRRASRVATPRSITPISPPWPAAGTSTLLMEAPLTFVAATGETARAASHTPTRGSTRTLRLAPCAQGVLLLLLSAACGSQRAHAGRHVPAAQPARPRWHPRR